LGSVKSPPLKVLVFGAGAIGTYIGGSLALKGHPVVFMERADIAEAIRSRGLRLEINRTSFHLEPSAIHCSSSLDEAISHGPFDIAIFALKSYDTPAAIQDLLPYHEHLPPILCLQNGVENETALATALGERGVIAGTVTSAIGRRAAGDILLERLRGVGVAVGHPLSSRLAAALDDAGLNAHLYPFAAAMKWSKMLTNLLANATSAILNITPAEVFAHPGLYRLEIEQLREALRVMAAQKLSVVDLPGTPVRLLAFGARLPLSLSKPLIQQNVGKGLGAKMPSFHIDLHSGRGKSEVEYLNGAVVRFGERLGVAAPVNRLLNETLMALTEGKLPLETFSRNPEKLLQENKEIG